MLVAQAPVEVQDAAQVPPVPVEAPAPAVADTVPPSADPAVQATPAAQTEAPSPPEAGQSEDGTVVVTGRSRRGDPLVGVNAASYELTQAADDKLVRPAAMAYKKGLPKPIRMGLHNFLWNLREPVVFINYLLQFKPGKAAETLGRFALNTTVGVGGVIDIAKKKPFRLPRRHNSFANTLGRYGVGPGPYLFLPLIGPTTVRDLFGTSVDQAISPIGPVQVFRQGIYVAPLGVLSALDYRIQIDDDLTRIKNSPDPYAARRKLYLEQRQAEIDRLRVKKKRVVPPPVVPTIPAQPTPASVPTGSGQ